MTDARYVELSGRLLADAHPACATYFGIYKRLENDVNGKPAYRKVGDDAKSMWSYLSPTATSRTPWRIIGQTTNIGSSTGAIGTGVDPQNPARFATLNHDNSAFLFAPDVRVTPLAPADDDEVTVVATSTPEARNAEKRKHAIDLELFEPKRARTPSVELETSVAKRRSTLTPDVDKKVVALVQPAIEEWVANKIDAAELERRKAEARKAAEAEDARLSALDAAHAKCTAAVAARVAHEEAGEKLRAAEDAAEAELRKLLPAEAGPSGVVKGE